MPRRQIESQIHRSVVQHLNLRGARGAVWWHTPNGGLRTAAGGAALKAMGTLAGVSDICALHDGRFFALELKAPGGRSTPAQMTFRDSVNAAGGFASEAVGLDAAIGILESWGLLKGAVQ